jgi:hypothetical protein
MGLPASQRRALSQIEQTLADDHPGLGALFAVFTRLTGHEAMPATEQVTAWSWRWQRRMWPGVVTVVGLAMATGVLLTISLMMPRPQVCPRAVTPVAPHVRSVPTGHQLACATQQEKPTNTSQSRLYVH